MNQQTEAELIRGWPFSDNMPLRLGEVHNIPWAIASGGPDGTSLINGYARIPWEGHPWTGCTDYNELPVEVHGGLTYGPHPVRDLQKAIDDLEDATSGTDHPFRVGLDHDIPVRPAITFADVGGWIGFDTGHAWDYWSIEELAKWGIKPTYLSRRLMAIGHPDKHDIRWTGERVIGEARNLAGQIVAAGRKEEKR